MYLTKPGKLLKSSNTEGKILKSAFSLSAFKFVIHRRAMGERGPHYTIGNVMQAFGTVSPKKSK